MKSLTLLLFAAMIIVVGWSRASAGDKVSIRLAKVLFSAGPEDRIVAWVFLTDKGSHELLKSAVPLSVVSEKAIQRRLNVCSPENVVDYTDVPVEEQYVGQIASGVLAVRNRSKWFNAVSVVATPAQLETLESLPFVRQLDLVARFKRSQEPMVPVASTPATGHAEKNEQVDSLNYGPSFGQLNQINVPAVHNTGNHAEGIIIGMFDDGWKILNHQSYDSLASRIIATHDFVDHKTSVIPYDPGAGAHGVATLSTIGGYKPGQLIGPAFGASFILSRTENDSSETPIEEDNWAAAVEWAESLGVQVTSTSLGYFTFDAPYTSLTAADMNGRTAIISIAATMAARKGVVVVNSAGNDASRGGVNTLVAPADADSIVTAGAVTASNAIASFSSYGPTSDGRIKPDVVALGVNVYAASSGDTAGYILASGTSFSCPLTAGVAALLVKAHPNATPMQVLNALRNTASQHATPDNHFGWGIVNALAAVGYINSVPVSGPPLPTTFALDQNYPNPFNPGTWIRYEVPVTARVTITVYDLLGRQVATLVDRTMDASATARLAYWDGSGSSGLRVASGVYFYRMTATPIGKGSAGGFTTARSMVLVK